MGNPKDGDETQAGESSGTNRSDNANGNQVDTSPNDASLNGAKGDEDNSKNQWQTVGRRRGKKNDDAKVVQGDGVRNKQNPRKTLSILERMSMSFFVTNFPKNVTAKDLWHRCLKFGTVVDVFIPDRLSKAGRRFGFIRFIRVDNATTLLSNLKTIWFGNYMMFADMVRYNRSFGKKEEPINVSASQNATKETRSPTNVNSGSYAEVLKGGAAQVINPQTGNGGENKDGNNIPINPRRIVKVTALDENSGSNSLSVLLKIKDVASVPLVNKWLSDEGFTEFETSYIGGRWIHFTFANLDAKNAFLTNMVIKSRFCAFKSISKTFVPDERMVWVELFGLPKGAWNQESLSNIMQEWGSCVFFDIDWKNAFSICKACVLTKSQRNLVEELQISMDGQLYDIWLKEFAMWEPRLSKIYPDSSSVDSSKDDDFDDFLLSPA